jgi:hypothetical protein
VPKTSALDHSATLPFLPKYTFLKRKFSQN